jgi:alanyl-tRNA synthetase
LESDVFIYEDLRMLSVFLENQSPKDLQQISKSAFSKYGLDILLLGGNQNGKIFFNSFCSSNATSKDFKAGNLVRSILSMVGAKGGGKPDSASGGGPDNGQLPAVLEKIKQDPATGLA